MSVLKRAKVLDCVARTKIQLLISNYNLIALLCDSYYPIHYLKQLHTQTCHRALALLFTLLLA